MVNPYRRGLGLGGRGEPMPYTGGGSARPLEPYRGGGRAVQLEDDPYADPSRTPPTYGDDGAGESTYNRRREPKQQREPYDGPSRFDPDFGPGGDAAEDGMAALKAALDEAGGDEQTYGAVEAWRKRMKAQGWSDEEIDQMEQSVMDSYGSPGTPYK